LEGTAEGYLVQFSAQSWVNSPCLIVSKDYLEMQFSFLTVFGFFILNLQPSMFQIMLRPTGLFQSLHKRSSEKQT